MIPQFPNFKKIDIDDKKSIELYVKKYEPYSTFNFKNILAWDIKSERRVSTLNNNLIILSSDNDSGELFLTFLGSNKSDETVVELIDFAKLNKISQTLRFITQETIVSLKNFDLSITEDRDSFDYIYDVKELANLHGSKYKSKRHLSKRFVRDYASATFDVQILTEESSKDVIMAVIKKWEENKNTDNKLCDLSNEEKAIKWLLENTDDHKLFISSVFLNNKMIGFSIDEVLSEKYALAHFIKADRSYKGIYEFLNEKTALFLLKKNIKFWNWQQDLNITGLRKLKESYHPVNFLKKYKVAKTLSMSIN